MIKAGVTDANCKALVKDFHKGKALVAIRALMSILDETPEKPMAEAIAEARAQAE